MAPALSAAQKVATAQFIQLTGASDRSAARVRLSVRPQHVPSSACPWLHLGDPMVPSLRCPAACLPRTAQHKQHQTPDTALLTSSLPAKVGLSYPALHHHLAVHVIYTCICGGLMLGLLAAALASAVSRRAVCCVSWADAVHGRPSGRWLAQSNSLRRLSSSRPSGGLADLLVLLLSSTSRTPVTSSTTLSMRKSVAFPALPRPQFHMSAILCFFSFPSCSLLPGRLVSCLGPCDLLDRPGLIFPFLYPNSAQLSPSPSATFPQRSPYPAHPSNRAHRFAGPTRTIACSAWMACLVIVVDNLHLVGTSAAPFWVHPFTRRENRRIHADVERFSAETPCRWLACSVCSAQAPGQRFPSVRALPAVWRRSGGSASASPSLDRPANLRRSHETPSGSSTPFELASRSDRELTCRLLVLLPIPLFPLLWRGFPISSRRPPRLGHSPIFTNSRPSLITSASVPVPRALGVILAPVGIPLPPGHLSARPS
ncbi:hypothetical protein F5X68DRAFT_50046 [Plectosphaerella plurivora]|uniref:Uncharacterized protein n=1 Tax=Plectosphaerella plurivora TaxID=936078 RepID=A0A9P8V155_9PEZI|nr:hypothetical protein F5X68DRAFT_50046 [Plectosphaerella plurivora]